MDKFLTIEEKRVQLGLRRPTGTMQTSAIPWEVFRLDGEPVSADDFENGYFPDEPIFIEESDLIPNPEP